MSLHYAVKVVATGLLLLGGAAPSHADDFYAGRQVILVIGNSPGTSYDASARLIARHLGQHIPGKPNFVPQNMPGATGLIAANHVSNVAPQDGSVISNAHQSLPLRQLLGDKQVKYDALKLQWIGSPDSSNNTITVWHTVPVKSFADVRTRTVIMGSTTKAAANYIEVIMANKLAGAKFKLVTGYTANNIDLAMERGEVEGRAGQSWAGFKATKPDWVRDKKMTVIAQLGLAPDPELPDVPLLQDLTQDSDGRQIVELFASQIALGRPLFAAAGVPKERVAVLRAGFEAMIASPAFLSDAERMNHDVRLVTGPQLEAIVAGMMKTSPELAAKANAIQD